MNADSRARGFAVPVCSCLAFLAGCANRQSADDLPSVDSTEVAKFAMEHYDADHNGAIDATEMASCPPLKVALANYDADRNGQLSAEEIKCRIDSLYGPSATVTIVDCTVTVLDRPLHGATVKFRPVAMLEAFIKPAQGVTDDSGIARMSLSSEDLSDEHQDARPVQPGLYHVEITHPTVALPNRYNTATELGFEADPMKEHTGTRAWFDLKPR